MYADIGGMDIQKQEVREAVELPLTHFELYKQVKHMDAKKCTALLKQRPTLCPFYNPVVLLQLVRSRFSNIMCPKNEVS